MKEERSYEKAQGDGGIFPPSETIFLMEGTAEAKLAILPFVLKKWRLSGGAAGVNKNDG